MAPILRLLLLTSCAVAWIKGDEVTEASGHHMGENCKTDEECQQKIANSTCSGGECGCSEGYYLLSTVDGSTCDSNDAIRNVDYAETPRPPTTPRQEVDPKMIIIMVVLAVMFVGICVALHLFSKARFRNHRTIFNSPHPRLMHIKLGKKKGMRRTSHSSLEPPGSRQLSICSQLSPLQSRRGSHSASPDVGRKPHSGPGEKRDASSAQARHRPESVSSMSDQHHSKKDLQKKGLVNESVAASDSPSSPTVIVSSGHSQTKANAHPSNTSSMSQH